MGGQQERLLGRKVNRQGSGPQNLIVSCEQDAKHINEQTNSTSLSRKIWTKPYQFFNEMFTRRGVPGSRDGAAMKTSALVCSVRLPSNSP